MNQVVLQKKKKREHGMYIQVYVQVLAQTQIYLVASFKGSLLKTKKVE